MIVHDNVPFNSEPPRSALAETDITAVDTFYTRHQSRGLCHQLRASTSHTITAIFSRRQARPLDGDLTLGDAARSVDEDIDLVERVVERE
jgi:hypothetical protein